MNIYRRARRSARQTVTIAAHSGTRLLDLTRRGDRTVIMAPPHGLRLGNFLYLWLRADQRTRHGRPTRVLETPAMARWLETFPALRALTVPSSTVRFSDRREWDNTYLYQRFGVDFAADDLAPFIRSALAPQLPSQDDATLVVNIRRGDYYTDFVDKYAFDQIGYVCEALTHFEEVPRIRVVSDDADWCREHLADALHSVSPVVQYDEPEPFANFCAVASARRLIGSNSTFSYWGGYAATALHDDAVVVMPRFHGRMGPDRTDAHQLDPTWIAIDGHH